MSKYAPLAAHLQGSDREELPMTFGEIETVIGEKLPASAFIHRAWWSNNATNNVMTRVWREAGYISVEVDLTGRKLIFRRSAQDVQPLAAEVGSREQAESGADEEPATGFFSRVFGALRDTVTTKPGADLTEPADTEWDAAR